VHFDELMFINIPTCAHRSNKESILKLLRHVSVFLTILRELTIFFSAKVMNYWSDKIQHGSMSLR